jgi:hypothetical protein
MHINEKYNLGLLVLFHLFLIIIVEWVFFQYMVIPTIHQHIEHLGDKLLYLDETTLKKYGIKHDKTVVNTIYSLSKSLANKNDKLFEWFNHLSQVNETLPPFFETNIKQNGIAEEIQNNKKKFNANVKIFAIFLGIIIMIAIWIFIHSNTKHIKINWVELILGNIIPISIILAFELYFINNIIKHYKVMSHHGFIHECLSKIYSN